MVIRIRYVKSRHASRSVSWRDVALTAAALLTPSALIAFTMAFWIIASDMRWTSEFFLSHGLFSHWEVWLATAAVLLLLARLLDKLSHQPPCEE